MFAWQQKRAQQRAQKRELPQKPRATAAATYQLQEVVHELNVVARAREHNSLLITGKQLSQHPQ